MKKLNLKKHYENFKSDFEKVKELFNKKQLLYILIFAIIGLLIHLELMIRQSSNPDTFSIGVSYIAGSWEVSLGRWLNVIISKLRFGLSTAVFTGIVSIIIMVIASVFLIDLLEIKKKANKIICTLLTLILPSFTITMTYFYCSDVYQLSMLFAILMPWFIFKFKNRKVLPILLGALCITLSLAGYQSYLGVALSLCMMIAILNLLDKEKDYNFKDLLIDVLRCVIATGIGFIIYAIISKLFLIKFDVNVSSYSGASNISIMKSILAFPASFKEAYTTFIELLFGNTIIDNAYFKRKVFYIIIIASLFVSLVIKGIKRKNKINFAIAVILALLMPVAFNSILFIATERTTNILMSTPMFMFLIYLVVMMDKFKFNIGTLISYISLIIIMITYIVTMNASYISIDYIRTQTVEIAQRIMTNIEDTEGYKKDSKMCFVGAIYTNQWARQNNFAKMSKMDIGLITDWDYYWTGSYNAEQGFWWNVYTKDLLINFNLCPYEDYCRITKSEEFKEMPVYPDNGSIKLIDDIVVVKLTNTPYYQ